MNDLIILASNVAQLKWFKSKFKKDFKMINLEELYYCLGVECERNREARTITMNQKSYIKEVLKYFSMEECRPVSIPFDVNSNF